MVKVVINTVYGGFGLSHKGIMTYAEKKGINLVFKETGSALLPYHYYVDEIKDENYFYEFEIERDDPALVATVEELAEEANDQYSSLEVVEIPDGVQWAIAECDGKEWVEIVH